jgi:hypothetical protein
MRSMPLVVPTVLALVAGTCCGQNVPVQFYMWGRHDPLAPTWNGDSRFARMVHVDVSEDPEDAAGIVATKIDDYITDGFITSGTICIELFGLGWDSRDITLMHEDDKVTATFVSNPTPSPLSRAHTTSCNSFKRPVGRAAAPSR